MAAFQTLCGYNCKNFVADVEEDLCCNVCSQVAKRLRYTSCCWTSYCNEYLQTVIEQRLPCPKCGQKSFITYELVDVQKSIENLEVFCNEKESGCPWVGTLKQLEHHNEECGFVTIKCPLNCQQKFSRKNLHRHLAAECDKKPPKQEQQMQDAEKVMELKEELENCIDPNLKDDIHLYEFTMENYSEKKANVTEWRSPRMFTHPGGYKICVSIRTSVFGDHQQRALQAEVCSVRGEFDDRLHWPVTASFTLSLIDSKGNRKKHTIERKNWNKPKDRSEIIAHFDAIQVGHSNFAFIKDDELQKFLIGDSLTFQIFTHDILELN